MLNQVTCWALAASFETIFAPALLLCLLKYSLLILLKFAHTAKKCVIKDMSFGGSFHIVIIIYQWVIAVATNTICVPECTNSWEFCLAGVLHINTQIFVVRAQYDLRSFLHPWGEKRKYLSSFTVWCLNSLSNFASESSSTYGQTISKWKTIWVIRGLSSLLLVFFFYFKQKCHSLSSVSFF